MPDTDGREFLRRKVLRKWFRRLRLRAEAGCLALMLLSAGHLPQLVHPPVVQRGVAPCREGAARREAIEAETILAVSPLREFGDDATGEPHREADGQTADQAVQPRKRTAPLLLRAPLIGGLS